MKILTTLTTIDPLKGGGVCEVVYHLSNNMKNIDIEICSLDYDTPSNIINKWSIFNIKLFKAIDPFLYGFSPTLKKYILNNDADILHNHGVWEYTSFISLSWKKKLKKPFIITPHGMLDIWALRNSSLKKKFVYNIIEKRYLSNADCIHVLNKEEKKSIRALGLSNPICIIPNGIEIPKENEIKVPPIWEEKIIKGRKVLLFLGRFHPKKGLENLLKAWVNLTVEKKNKDWVLVFAGWSKDNYEKTLLDIILNNKLQNNVFFIGSVLDEKKTSTFQNADAFILPSFSEGLPMSILEAMSYKLPVLMTKECNLSEAFENESAIKIETNINSIEMGIERIITMKEIDRIKIGKNGFDFVVNNYSWHKISKDMESVYTWLLTKQNIPSCVSLDTKD